jgi:hypothetical protein
MGLHVRPVPVLARLVLGGVALHPRVALLRPARPVPVHSGAMLGGILLHLPMVSRFRLHRLHER